MKKVLIVIKPLNLRPQTIRAENHITQNLHLKNPKQLNTAFTYAIAYLHTTFAESKEWLLLDLSGKGQKVHF